MASWLLLTSNVDLRSLTFLGPSLAELPAPIAGSSNVLLIELEDGIYLPSSMLANLSPGTPRPLPVSIASIADTTYDAATLLKLLHMGETRARIGRETSALTSSLNATLVESQAVRETATEVAKAKLRVANLRAQVLAKREQLRSERAALASSQSALLPRARQVSDAQIGLMASRKQLLAANAALNQNAKRADRIAHALHERRRELVGELYKAFSITAGEHPREGTKIYRILGMWLPPLTPPLGILTHENTAALGYVAAVLHALSKYLDVPLRHKVVPKSSRSIIYEYSERDRAVADYPLYSAKGVLREDTEYAVWLLNKNIEQLCQTYAVPIYDFAQTLFNLRELIEAFIRGDVVSPHVSLQRAAE